MHGLKEDTQRVGVMEEERSHRVTHGKHIKRPKAHKIMTVK